MNIQTDQTPNKNINLGQAPLVDTQQVAKKYFPKVPVMYEKINECITFDLIGKPTLLI